MAGNYDLFIEITYELNKDKATINTNIKREQVSDILAEFLRAQIGQGADSRKAKERDVYHIKIGLDLSCDNFRVSDDTGNKGLRDGIIMRARGQYDNGLDGRV